MRNGENGSTFSQISVGIAVFVNLYKHVDLLLNDTKFKEPAALELQGDMKILPSLIIESLPTLNRGNAHLDRNFYRVLKLMCKALEEARDILDEYMISFVTSLPQTRTFDHRLAESRNRLKHAVSLYNNYCCNNGSFYNDAGIMSVTRFDAVNAENLLNMRECLDDLQDDQNVFYESAGPPKRILRFVAKLRAGRFKSTDKVYKWAKDEIDMFCRAGGLEALVNLLSFNTYSHSNKIQILQALNNLRILAENEDTKKNISTVINPNAVELIGLLIVSSSGHIQVEAVALMRALMRNNSQFDIKRLGAQPGILAALIKLLYSSRIDNVLANVMGILWEFTVLEENRCRIVNGINGISGSSEVLLQRLVELMSVRNHSPRIEFCAAALMQNLCTEKEIRAKILMASESLTSVIEMFDSDRLSVIKRVDNSWSPYMLMGWGVSMLDSGSEMYQIRGLDVLLLGLISESLLQLGAYEGAISRVVHLLDSANNSITVLEKASEALYRISMTEENEVKIGSCPIAIHRLVSLLESDSSIVRGNAVKVLDSLSFNPINKEKILEENRCMEKVAALLFHESFSAQSSAGSLLWNLSNTTTSNKIRIASIHGVPKRLSELLLSESPLVQEKAAGAIMSLSYNGRSRKMMASIGCTFERLIKLLDSVSILVHQNAAGALYNLSISPDNIATIGSHPRAVANLVSLLSSKCALVQEYAAGALGNLALLEEMREDMKQVGAMLLLRKLKNKSSNLPVKAQAKRALENLMV